MNETIIARATPPGIGGIGIVRISGDRVLTLMEQVLGKTLAPGVAYVGNFYDRNHQVLDCGVALYFAAPHSFTGEHVLELQGHGGLVVIESILSALLAWGGVRLAEPGEFSKRAFLNGKLDLVQAEAVADLIHAENVYAVKGALRSLRGEFSKVINVLSQDFLQIRSLLEASLDFSEEEEIQHLQIDVQQKCKQLALQLTKIIGLAKQGVLNQAGLNVIIAGEPNVGKSSLFNYLCGENRAIVTNQPGTTRDLLRETIYLEGLLVHLTDTAGLRVASDHVEQEGIRRAKAAFNTADVILYLQDVSRPMVNWPEFPETAKRILIFNKIDILKIKPQLVEEDQTTKIYLSVKEGLGLDLLLKVLRKTNSFTDVCGARQRHVQALTAAQKILVHLDEQGTLPLDVLAHELFMAHRELMTITGEVVVDDLLDQIFSKFCIGK